MVSLLFRRLGDLGPIHVEDDECPYWPDLVYLFYCDIEHIERDVNMESWSAAMLGEEVDVLDVRYGLIGPKNKSTFLASMHKLP